MAKTKARYVCSNCGAVSIKYQGKCFECGSWGTLTEEVAEATPAFSQKIHSKHSLNLRSKPKRFSELEDIEEERLATHITELDRVLGGGLMSASVVLVGGEPGIGKSTLMLQLAANLEGKSLLYVSAEESLHQIRNRAYRMNVHSETILLVSETQLENILETVAAEKPDVLIVDSIQTIFSVGFESSPGTVTQVRECTSKLMHVAKREGIAVFIIGHITKEGTIAGPKVLEHIVDTVLQFEGDSHYRYRILRALKNRFGSTNEIGVFEMTESGLSEVTNPSEAFLAERSFGVSGSCVCASLEGARPLLVEIQALVSKTNYTVPQRISSGFDQRRLSLLLAVLEKRIGLSMWSQDVFLNAAGGLRLLEPAVELAVCVAIASGMRDIPADSTTVAIGEIGLAGELRAVSHIERRIIEAEKLGFERVILPKSNRENLKSSRVKKNIEMIFSPTLNHALDAFLS